MRRSLAAACVAVATTGGVFAGAATAHAYPILCVATSMSLGPKSDDPNGPKAFQVWVTYCVAAP